MTSLPSRYSPLHCTAGNLCRKITLTDATSSPLWQTGLCKNPGQLWETLRKNPGKLCKYRGNYGRLHVIEHNGKTSYYIEGWISHDTERGRVTWIQVYASLNYRKLKKAVPTLTLARATQDTPIVPTNIRFNFYGHIINVTVSNIVVRVEIPLSELRGSTLQLGGKSSETG